MIFILAVVFFLLLLLVGGERGAVSLIALMGNILVFIAAVIAMSIGLPVILITILASIGVNSITILYQNGTNKKSAAALISVGIVMALLMCLVIWIGGRMHIGGLNEIELNSDLSLYYSFAIRVNMRKVCIAMIMIGLLGAVMDTAVAISSSLYEVYEHKPELTVSELFHSGITVGKDVLATTLNTLYFAYIGEALMLLLYLREYQYSLVSILNSKAFLQEFTCIMVSAIGCVLIIPISAQVTAKLLKEW
ncbi:YibE/F family protein [Bariatricus sp. SGI.154]|uniref:YibE/F family protein n=1 Tax=Bariatricus sp. SGI.154 TaxID=3420549 RepID=UPI003D08620A